MTEAPAIDCRNLTHRYGDFTAVDDPSLQVRRGETMGLPVISVRAGALSATQRTEIARNG